MNRNAGRGIAEPGAPATPRRRRPGRAAPHRGSDSGVVQRTGNRRARGCQRTQDRQRGQGQAPRAAQELPHTAKPQPRALSALRWSVPSRSHLSWEEGFGHTSHTAQRGRASKQPPAPSSQLPVSNPPLPPQPSPPTSPSIPVAQARTDSSVTTRPPRAPSPPTTQLPLQQESALVNQCSSLLICVFQAERRGGTQDCKSPSFALPQGARCSLDRGGAGAAGRRAGGSWIRVVQGPLVTVGYMR